MYDANAVLDAQAQNNVTIFPVEVTSYRLKTLPLFGDGPRLVFLTLKHNAR